MIDLATRIRIIRNELGISQERLGELAGVSKQAVGQWESGETKNIRNAALFALQRKTRFSAEWIATGRGPQRVADLSDPNIIDMSQLSPDLRTTFRRLFVRLANRRNTMSRKTYKAQ